MMKFTLIFLVGTIVFPIRHVLGKSEPPPTMDLSIQLPRAKIIVCEPLWVSFELKNLGQKPVKVQSDLSLRGGAISLEIAFEKGGFIKFYKPGEYFSDHTLSEDVVYNFEPIQKDESLVGSEWVLFNMAPTEINLHPMMKPSKNRGFVFKTPGHYRLKAVYERKGIRVESKTISIEVEALPKDEEEAFKLWCRPEIGETVQGGMGPAAIYTDLKQIVEKYPKSIYTAFSALALAEHFFKDNDDKDAKSKGLKYLEIAAQSSKNPRIQEQVVELRSSWGPKVYDEKYEEDVIRRVQSGEIYNIKSSKKKITGSN